MADKAYISFDGSWSHKRNAKECIVVAIDISRNLIIDYEVVRKAKNGVPGNYIGASNGMEVAALKGIIARLQSDPRIIGYVHDSDSKATAEIQRSGWNIEEFFDPNHISKCYDRRWAKANRSRLNGIGLKLKRWFNFLIHADYDDSKKVQLWRNAVEHFKGNHKHCPPGHEDLAAHPRIDDPAAIEELEQFIEDTVKLVIRTRNGFDSQMCESFNAVKLHFASKTFSWKISWEFRMAAAVLQVNDPLHWRTNLAINCHLVLPGDEAMRRLDAMAAEADQDNIKRRTAEAQEKERKRRRKKKEEESQITAGRGDYLGRPPRIQDKAVPGAGTARRLPRRQVLPIPNHPTRKRSQTEKYISRLPDPPRGETVSPPPRPPPPPEEIADGICPSSIEAPETPSTRITSPSPLPNDGPWSANPTTVEEVRDDEDMSRDPEPPIPTHIRQLPEDLMCPTWFDRPRPLFTVPGPLHDESKLPSSEHTDELEGMIPRGTVMVLRTRKRQGMMFVRTEGPD
jgi:hypothetical protein